MSFQTELGLDLVSKGIVVARVSLADTQVHNFYRFISKTGCVFQGPVEAKLRPDHDSIVVQLDIAAAETHQLISIPYSAYLQIHTTVCIVSNLFSNLNPLTLEGLDWNFGQDIALILELHC